MKRTNFVAALVATLTSSTSAYNEDLDQLQASHQLFLAQDTYYSHQCDASVQRMKAAAPNYSSLQKQSSPWDDLTFPENDIIRWYDYGSTVQNLSSIEKSVSWERLSDKYAGNTLFGKSGAKPDDTQQGVVGDCYFISAAAALAEQPAWLKSVFKTTKENAAGVYAVTLYPIGVPHVVVVDDNMPFKGGDLVFGNIGEDGALWGPILEKAFAKVAGNYEMISGGWFEEGIRMLTGAPAESFKTKDYKSDPSKLFKILQSADKNKLIMGAQTSTSGGGDNTKNSYGLSNSHAYTLLGTVSADGVNLIKLRNPWRLETYSGKYKDGDSAWTPALKKAANQKDDDDGIFFIEDKDFVSAFEKFSISYYDPKGVISWYQVEGDTTDNQMRTFSFDLPSNQDFYVSVDTWNHRMYPDSCISSQHSTITVTVKQNGKTVGTRYYYDQKGFKTTPVKAGKSGKYTIEVTIDWADAVTKDYNVRVYANKKVTIKDDAGKTNQINTWSNTVAMTTYLKEGYQVLSGALETYSNCVLMASALAIAQTVF